MQKDAGSSGAGEPGEAGGALPRPARDNVATIAGLAEREHARVGPLRAFIERISAVCATPGYFLFVIAFIVGWIVVNVAARALGWAHYDEPPFFWLQGIVSSTALLLTISVLIRQDRMAQLAEHRAHLDLQINMLTERKVTKALELLAASRQGGDAKGRAELGELLEPADAEAIMGVIKQSDEKPPE